ncbi:apoptosis regulator R1-like [Stylophora pistillata]|uniref:Apoptosis regulator R1 n=1 Tax=Stylophora pistillata TaxID=50429 RepID=G8XQY4_STYPI|nr:apoptosis regulator R1-like [Stylophora pistillata]XP_022803541.1 apoptosis regulator R1-like [Stylophora pistillata]XP_022803542.1 apoptosis regulator R1-like [Stylophora pistillata]ACH97122.1 Bcl-2-like protein [Stylophora pistillata]PFX17402.1 Apoptosis regulator R1 [Stylophora pistillata]
MAGATAALNNEDLSFTPNTSEMSSCDKIIIEKALSLTQDYISFRLRSKFEQNKLQGLHRHFLIPPQSTNASTSTLRKLATDTEAKYPDLFESVCTKLDITPASAHRTFVCVAKEIFQEETNWGRIVALYAFGGVVAHHFVETQRPEMVQKIVEWTATFIAENLLTWIKENGGWDGFVAHFSDSSQSQTMWKSLFTVGSICAAGLTLLALNK